MNFNFETYTKEQRRNEIAEEGKYFKEGLCNFELIDISNGVSQRSGSPMITIEMMAWDENGKSGKIKDYFTESPFMQKKFRDFLDSVERSSIYENGDFSNLLNLVGVEGKFRLTYKTDKDGSLQKNIRYLIGENSVKPNVKQEASNQAYPFNDDIAF